MRRAGTMPDSKVMRLVILAIVAMMLCQLPLQAPLLGEAKASPDPAQEDANQGGSGYAHFVGNWNVDAGDDLHYANQTILLDGNLLINPTGSLALSNVTLIFNCTSSSTYHLEVQDSGELEVLKNSNITAARPNWHFWV
jgi:hypothetical protein